MINLYKTLGGVFLISSIFFSGCSKELKGIVEQEFGSVPRIVESSGAIFGNESIKFSNPTYGIVLNTKEGEYTLDIKNCPEKSVYLLAKTIEKGDSVKIKYGGLEGLLDQEPIYIYDDFTGYVGSNKISLIRKKNH